MMTDSVEGEMSNNGGGSGKQDRPRASETVHDQAQAANDHARGYDHALTYAHLRAYASLAVKASGLLALLLSTVLLLGGYVQSLGKMDFSCIVAITVIQAAGIFQDWETNVQYLSDSLKIFNSAGELLSTHIPALVIIVLLPFAVLITYVMLCVMLFYMFGPLACAAISSWRIAKLSHSNYIDGTDSMANMMAALNIFYSLIIFQGTMSLVMILLMGFYRQAVVRRLLALERLSDNKWGEITISRYIFYISVRCRKDPLSIKGMDLIKYGAELLDSESQLEYLNGARLLSAFVKKGEDVSWVLLPSRHRIQRLIDSLMISSSHRRLDEACVHKKSRLLGGRCYAVLGTLTDQKEIRELAATIVADVAAHIDDLSNYPGAIRCIYSLFQDPVYQRLITRLQYGPQLRKLMMDQNRMVKRREHRHRNMREGGTSNDLIQQGLTILERLASNSDDNRRIICGTPGLLPKITAPVYSATLIEDVKTMAWADIVTICLKVLYQLIRAPDGSHEIFSDVQALRNLKSILELGNTEADHQELQLVAMEILTELALDLSINLSEETKKVLITKQLQLFLFANGDDEEESAAIAGRALVSLSTNNENNSAVIMTMENGIIGHLTGTLDDENQNITRRTIAAEIMANLCAHCNVDSMKELLPKVLRQIMPTKRKSQEREASGGQNNPASGDEENQGNSVSTNNEQRHNISKQGDDTETKEIPDQERKEQEAFLSLAQVMCDKVNSADLEGAIQKAVDENDTRSKEQRREAFVEKLKTIIDDNCHPTPDSLRIVKLCAQIAKSVMQCEEYVVIFRNKGFKGSLSKASKTMSELESCMLFVGTDFGPKKTVRPLFSEIEKSFGQI